METGPLQNYARCMVFLYSITSMYQQHIINKIAHITSSDNPETNQIYVSHLNASQRLVGPNGVSSNHIDPVVVDGNSTLILTWGRQSRRNV